MTLAGQRDDDDAAAHHIAGNPHADTLLMAYFAEAETPGGGRRLQLRDRRCSRMRANLIENIKKRNLQVDRIVPLHGTIAPYSDLLKDTGRGHALIESGAGL